MSQDREPQNGHVDVADEREDAEPGASEPSAAAADGPTDATDGETGDEAPAAAASGDDAEASADAEDAAGDAPGDAGDDEQADDAMPKRSGPGEKLSDAELQEQLFALVFAAAEPLSDARLVKLLQRPKPARVRAALEALGERLSGAGFPLELRMVAGGWQLFTVADQAPVVSRLVAQKGEEKVSPAALETLAVVAYRQPVTKAEIEAIRGVQAGPMLRSLVDRGLVKVTGRAEVPGSPLLYGTTKKFLDSFGLGRIEDLPRDGELVRD